MSTSANMLDWTIPGARGEPIFGTAHIPAGPARAVVILAHGFKGYKDYGFLPVLGGALAESGCLVHRFNFSHSGMTNATATFARPELFEDDSWNTQVEDLQLVIAALGTESIPSAPSPLVLVGHSRGGVTCLLAAGRGKLDREPAAVVTLASPARCSMKPDEAAALRRDGRLASPSSRTGQTLYVGRRFLVEQEERPDDFDLLHIASHIACPALIAHGTADPTVECSSAEAIGRAIGDHARVVLIDGANHVFDTPNPAPVNAATEPKLAQVIAEVRGFVSAVAAR